MKGLLSKIASWFLPISTIIGIILQLAEKLLVNYLSAKSFSKKAKYITIAFYALAEGYGEEVAKDTSTKLDDEGVQTIIRMCQEVSKKHKFNLPVIDEL